MSTYGKVYNIYMCSSIVKYKYYLPSHTYSGGVSFDKALLPLQIALLLPEARWRENNISERNSCYLRVS